MAKETLQDWSALRESKDISLRDIVQQTNISLTKLEALERQEFSELGSETFIAGYIRRYARILNEDPEKFLQVYKESLVAKDKQSNILDESEGHKISTRALTTSRQLSILYISLGIIVLWIAVKLFIDSDSAKKDEQLDQASSSSTIEGDSEGDSTELKQARSESSSANVEVDNKELDAAVLESSKSTPEPSDVILEEDLLVMSFSGECWVKVKDASGKVLFAKLQTEEDNLEIFGQAPFELMLGNARVVEVMINGRAVPIQPLPNRKTIRTIINR